ncbi:MAG: beta-ketoacyl-ACP synthase III [Syntrophomonadaceae bacterium]|nr:beta-ketoacyl-ACP synthase III [Syntrophomonadaceae bacterium]
MRVKALGIGYCLPERVLSNQDLEKMVDTNDAWIVERTGIKERRILGPEGKNSDISVVAARRALQDAQIDPLQLDLIIVGTVTPDMPFPATACILQAELGAAKAAAFDLAAGCTGFIYAMSVAEKLLLAPEYNHILIVGCDIPSSVVDYTDRNTCILFGDGAGAMVLGKSEGDCGILSTCIGSDGNGAGLLYMPAGGSALPATHATVDQRLHYLKMNGNEIFKFATKIVAETTAELLRKAGLTYEDIDLFVPHQANWRIIQSAMRRMKLPPEKAAINLDVCGNISAGSIPVALCQYNEKHPLARGTNILMVAFGTGLTYGGAILRWGRD